MLIFMAKDEKIDNEPIIGILGKPIVYVDMSPQNYKKTTG